MESESRAQKRKITDLKRQLLLKQAAAMKEKTNAFESTDESIDELPVHELTETDVSSLNTLAESFDHTDKMEVIGVDDEGNEIVYMGDALSRKTYKVPSHKYNLTPAKEPELYGRTLRDRKSTAEIARELPANAPTIANQLRQARDLRTKPKRESSSKDPKTEYKRYFNALKAKNYEFAIQGFKRFVVQYPSHEYADNAQYWLGEAYYDQKMYEEATVEFKKVVDSFSEGNKTPDAMLKLGFCLEKSGKPSKASQWLAAVVETYPDTKSAELAKEKISRQ